MRGWSRPWVGYAWDEDREWGSKTLTLGAEAGPLGAEVRLRFSRTCLRRYAGPFWKRWIFCYTRQYAIDLRWRWGVVKWWRSHSW